MRRVLALALLLGAAYAACGERPYTLELPMGLAGGEALRYRGGVLELSRACFEGEDLSFEAEKLRFDKKTGRVEAEAPEGTIRDWAFAAQTLSGTAEALVLTEARFAREGVSLKAERAELRGEAIGLFDLYAEAFGYRFWAERGRLVGERFVAEALRATPCRVGEALGLSGRRAVFDLKAGRLLFEESVLRYYGFCLARPERLLLDARRPPKLALPLRLAYGDGLTLGVEGFPLFEEGVPLGAERAKFTLLAEGIGGARPRLRFGVSDPEAGFSLAVGPDAFALNLRAPGVRSQVFEDGRGYLELRPDAPLAPFALAYSSPAEAGVAAGVYARTRLAAGPFTLRPYLRLALAPGEAPWAAFGGRAEGRLGPVRLWLSGTARLGEPAGFWADLAEHERLRFQAEYRALSLAYALDPAAGWSWLELAYDAALKARARVGLGALRDRRELVLAYRAPDPPPGGFSASPEVGYDLGLGRLSRLGLDLAYADGCLVYRLGARYLAEPWPGETEGFALTMGVALP